MLFIQNLFPTPVKFFHYVALQLTSNLEPDNHVIKYQSIDRITSEKHVQQINKDI